MINRRTFLMIAVGCSLFISSLGYGQSSDAKPIVTDGSLGAASKSLANTIVEGYLALGRNELFHRVAIPYFTENGASVVEYKLGIVVAELLSVELANRKPFVVVERERLDQVMKEYRLADLGIVDSKSVAQFGKVLGAQTIISGSVNEAGAKYLVTVRQVEVETAQVLATASVEIDRAGLIALSEASVVLRSKGGATFRSALVPGWGQFYNGETFKSVTFMGLGLGSLFGGLGYYFAAETNRADYDSNSKESVEMREKGNDQVQIANWLLRAFAVVWTINVADAYLSGQDSATVQIPDEYRGGQP